MGRPSLEVERTNEIVLAASRCIALHGLSGATLELIAKESGFSRGHIRYYVGNRDDLIDLVVQNALEPYRNQFAELAELPGGPERVTALLDFLFGEGFQVSGDYRLFNALFQEVQRDQRLHDQMQVIYRRMQRSIEDTLIESIDGASRPECRLVAFALLCLTLGITDLALLSIYDDGHAMARDVADSLVEQMRVVSKKKIVRQC
jgi:TetR/AcrR family transcriptional repressor of bet genes